MECNLKFKKKCNTRSYVHSGTSHEGPEGEQRHSSTLSLTSALDVVGDQRHAPAALPSGKTHYSLCRRLGGSQDRTGWVRKISPPPGFDPWTIQPVASRYTDWAIPAHQDKFNTIKKCYTHHTGFTSEHYVYINAFCIETFIIVQVCGSSFSRSHEATSDICKHNMVCGWLRTKYWGEYLNHKDKK
jgi:hypothetical protein